MQQGLAKYQSRRINTGNPITSSSPTATGRSSGMFNQVPAREEQRISLEKTVTTSSASHSSDAEVKPIERPKFSPERAAKVPQHMFELAKQYVEVFQEQGGKELNAAEKSALILEVAVFYSHPTRTGRLETLVTALSPKAC
jgi:hypothetical protein